MVRQRKIVLKYFFTKKLSGFKKNLSNNIRQVKQLNRFGKKFAHKKQFNSGIKMMKI